MNRKMKPTRPRAVGRRHRALLSMEPGTWSPEAAAAGVRGYPKTRAAYERQLATLRANSAKARAAGKLTRRGVPNGWSGMKPQIEECRRNSRTEAERLTDTVFPPEDRQTRDDRLAAEVLSAMAEIAFCETYTVRERLRAARLFAEFTVAKPRRVAPGTNPGDFLWQLAAEAAEENAAAPDTRNDMSAEDDSEE